MLLDGTLSSFFTRKLENLVLLFRMVGTISLEPAVVRLNRGAFRDHYQEFKKLGLEVFGVSTQNLDEQIEFAKGTSFPTSS